jgi:pyrroline-5-carboxylate reductase
MARALALGWGEPVLARDAGSGRARTLADELGGEAVESNVAVAEQADVVVLCHKPRQFVTVSREIGDKASIVASVLGGISVDSLQKAYPGAHVFRLMPNTPVAVRKGIICYAPAQEVDTEIEARVIGLFERLGTVVRVEERLIDVAAAVMSVGPAYVALLVEAQVDAAVRHGLKPALASRLAVETMAGSATLLATRAFDTLSIRREVTSPAGTTARGLEALERGGVRSAFQDAMDAVLAWSSR